MDEDDSFPPVATEPEDPGRPPPERQRVFMARRLGAVVAGILILVLLVLGIRGCLNARKERAFENYARDLSTLVQQSQQISDGFFARFSDPQNSSELRFETDVRADRSAADGLVTRAESLDPPGELSGAQDDVVEAFQLRADGLGAIADQVGPALGDEDFAEAIEQMTIEMQDFIASDVLYARGREEINAVLQEEGIDEDVPASFFYPRVAGTEQPDLEWLDETAIQENLAAIAGNTAEPGLHDLAITSVLINGVDVAPDTPATVTAEGQPEVDVTIANEGDTEETDVEIAVAVSGGDEPIDAEEVLPGIAPAESRTATIPLEPAPSTGSAVTIDVTLGPRLGEEDTEDNEFSYEVTFE
jgi:hypothetical protein